MERYMHAHLNIWILQPVFFLYKFDVQPLIDILSKQPHPKKYLKNINVTDAETMDSIRARVPG